MSRLIDAVEDLLWKSRTLVLLAVFSSLLASAILFISGNIIVFNTTLKVLTNKISAKNIYKELVSLVITAMDIYLIGTVLLIFSLGLYDLFIKSIEKMKSSKILAI